LATAAAKVVSFAGPANSELSYLSPRWHLLAAVVEMLLGLTLLHGIASRRAWLACVTLFLVMAGVSLYLAMNRQADCGCFGRVKIHPWWTLTLDLGIIVALLICQPPAEGTATGRRPIFRPLWGAAGLLALAGVSLAVFANDPAQWLAHQLGLRLAVVPVRTDLGEAEAGTARVIQVVLRNDHDHPVRIVGGSSTCSCVVTNDLPLTIPPRGSQVVNVQIIFTGEPGQFQHQFAFLTDDERQGRVVARVQGTVLPNGLP
jgi:hypothetical protein